MGKGAEASGSLYKRERDSPFLHQQSNQSIMLSLIVCLVAALGFFGADANITAAQLKAIMPNCKHPEYLTNINAALKEGSINSCFRQSAFLAQLAHESGELVYMEELASGSAYEGRSDLGNTQPGDGRRYKGRGPIQLTGRANYRSAGKALGLDLEGSPAQVATPSVGFRTAVWFWTSHNLNAVADQGTLDSFRRVTRTINGGTNGQADREHYWGRAKSALGCATKVPCSANGKSGVCIAKSTCSGTSVAGQCPGAADIQCCV